MSPFKILPLFVVILLGSCSAEKGHTNSMEVSSILKSEIEMLRSQLPAEGALKSQDYLILQPFKNPDQIKVVDGKIDTFMTIKYAENKLFKFNKPGTGGSEIGKNINLYHRSYNGNLVGPTLRIKPGDSLLLNMINHLPYLEGPRDCEPFAPHLDSLDPNIINPLRFNFTNLHTHGFHVSPMGHGDNVFVTLAPGCEFQTRMKLPENHAMGTFWYHAHYHGSTAIQVSSGMGGAIIIEGGLDNQPDIKPMEEKIFMLQQMPFLPDSSGSQYTIEFIEEKTFGPNTWKTGIEDSLGWRTSINGQIIPVIEMESKEAQRWRFVHAGVRETVNLKLVKQVEDRFEQRAMYAIAEDGIAYGYRQKVDSMTLLPGYRVDLLVQEKLVENSKADSLYLIDANSPVLFGDGYDSEKVLALVIIKPPSGKPIATKLPSSEALSSYAPYPSLVDVPVTDELETVRFNIDTSQSPPIFEINGVPFSHYNEPRKLILNKVQKWSLTSGLADHPFHIHVNHFQLMEKWKNTAPDSVPPVWVKQELDPIWKDTYFVQEDDSIIIKTVYKDFIGDFVLHCHILDHEDQGMMQCVRIDSADVIQNYLLDRSIKFCGPDYNNSLSDLNNQ